MSGQPAPEAMTSRGYEPLLAIAGADLYRRNGFRALGLLAGADMRDIQKRFTMLEMSERTGAPLSWSRVLAPVPPLEPHEIRDAARGLRDPESRLLSELFWFWSDGEATSEGLVHLGEGDVEATRSLWWKTAENGGDRMVAIHNLAVLHHALALDLESQGKTTANGRAADRDRHWREALSCWGRILDEEAFWSRVTERIRELDDARLPTGTARRFRDTLPLALLSINAKLALEAIERDGPDAGTHTEAQRHLDLMRASKLPARDVDEALRRAVEPTIRRLNILCTRAAADAGKDKSLANQVTVQLLEQAMPLLHIVDAMLPDGHAAREAVRDELAQRAMGCVIDFGNATEKWIETLDLFTRIKPLPVGTRALTRFQENLEILTQNAANSRCWFCEKHEAENGLGIEIKMFGDVQRIPMGYQTRTTWNHITIKVPRCPACKQKHDRNERRTSWRGAGTGAVVGALASVLFWGLMPTAGGFWVVTLIAGALGLLTGFIAEEHVAPDDQTKSKLSRNEFPRIVELKKQGWAFGEKPATS